MNRTTEFVLGLIGGIFGILSGITALLVGGVFGAFNASGSGTIMGGGIVAIIVSIVGIVSGIIAKSKAKLGGILMLLSGIIGFISIFVFYILPGVLLIIGGIMCLVKKSKSPTLEIK